MRSNPNKLFVLQSVVSKASHKVRRSVGSQRKAYNKWVDYDNWKLIGNTIHNLITSLPNHKKVQHFSEKYFIQILSLIMSIRLKKIFTYPIGICAEEWVSEGIILLLPKLRSNCKSHIRLFAIWTVWFVYPRSGTYTNEYHWKDKTNDAKRLRYPCQAPICLSINRRETRYLARNRLFLYTIDAVYNFQYGK